jgi:phosphoketolase
MTREIGTQPAAQPLSPAQLELMNAWWRAANYLSVGQIYLLDNPLLENGLDRFHLGSGVIDRVPKLGYLAAYAKQAMRDKLIGHVEYIRRHGDDMPEVRDWRWPEAGG